VTSTDFPGSGLGQPEGEPRHSNESDTRRANFDEALRAARGAWPADFLGSDPQRPLVGALDPTGAASYVPDLSLIRGEWYFADGTARDISAIAEGNVLLAGVPTLAAQIPGSTLVESSPWAAQRLDLSRVHHAQIEFEDFWTDQRFDFVAFDPPWYYPALTNWVNNAAYFTQRHSKILFPLFGEGTRPGAADERRRILEHCNSIGSVQIATDLVVYDTPRFEIKALQAAGVRLVEPWRRSDLVTLTVETPSTKLTSIREPFEWDEVKVGKRLHALRRTPVRRPPGPEAGLIVPIPGVNHWTLDSVSRRDPRWEFVNVWASDNRVAYTPDPQRLSSLLRSIGDEENDAVLRPDIDAVRSWVEADL
jgi:hypothetical protein